MKASKLIFTSLIVVLTGIVISAESDSSLTAEVIAVYPHDVNAFTQGLTFENGYLYEGTGQYGSSWLGKRTLENTELIQRHNLSRRHFGEGITIHDNRIFQLTWQSNLGFVYDLGSFELIDTFYLEGQGWGLTSDENSLIVSDGSARLRFLDADTYQLKHSVDVSDDEGPVDNLNELEYINGEVWANIWYSDHLVRINPETGQVSGKIDLTGLYPERNSQEEVLNGIAWDSESERLFVTGKLWPSIFELKLH